MRGGIRAAIWVAGTALTLTHAIEAQQAADPFTRARQLVRGGNPAAGRIIVDSVLTSAQPNSEAFLEALYWRAALAPTARDSARSFRQLVVDHPAAARTADALLALGRLALAAGDRAGAALHLERYLVEHLGHPERAAMSVTVVRSLADVNEWPRACAALALSRDLVSSDDIERRNQLDYFEARCRAMPASAADAPRPPAAPAGSGADTAVTPDHTGRYTVQVAAYVSRTEADRAVSRLRGRGYDARAVGAEKPFRVRVGRFATRAEATSVERELRARGYQTLITVIGAEER